jgi:putative hydrolase of the HAD superfamily
MKNSKVIVFDLDDTLYPEQSFFKSGLVSASKYLEKKLPMTWKSIYAEFLRINELYGRKNIFDVFLKQQGVYSKKLLNSTIQIYRNHDFAIMVDSEMRKFLKSFKNNSIYIVTDGHKLVQAKKINKLKIKELFQGVYITNCYGIDKQKPSIYCFRKIAIREKIKLSQLVHIADNPKKDFVSLNRCGATTIKTNIYVNNHEDSRHIFNANYRVNSLEELQKLLHTLGVICEI